jgi:hypothetical protein
MASAHASRQLLLPTSQLSPTPLLPPPPPRAGSAGLIAQGKFPWADCAELFDRMDRIFEAKGGRKGSPSKVVEDFKAGGPHAVVFEALALRFGLLQEGHTEQELEALLDGNGKLYRAWRARRLRKRNEAKRAAAAAEAAEQAPSPAGRRAGRQRPPPVAAA